MNDLPQYVMDSLVADLERTGTQSVLRVSMVSLARFVTIVVACIGGNLPPM